MNLVYCSYCATRLRPYQNDPPMTCGHVLCLRCRAAFDLGGPCLACLPPGGELDSDDDTVPEPTPVQEILKNRVDGKIDT
jgi:hypothetical protein